MNIWLLTVGEPLPLNNNEDRLHRVGILSDYLASRNHNVIWWSSTIDHFRKIFYFDSDKNIKISENLSLKLLHGRLYKKNISINRLIHNAEIANKFRYKSKYIEKPDIIISSFPTIEMTKQAVIYGREHCVPVLVDVRDLWPDIFLDVLPKSLKSVSKFFFQRYINDSKYIFNNANAILGITDKFVNWGLEYGNRLKTKNDQTFHLGSSVDHVNKTSILIANNKWDGLGVTQDKFVISFFGSITSNKLDLDIVITEAKLIQAQDPNILFVICGEGDQKQYFIEMASNVKNILFPGWANRAEIHSLMLRSDLGIAPIKNRFDYLMAIPNKPIEYFSFGKPVISSLKGELENLIKKHNVGRIYESNHGNLSNIIYNIKNNQQELVEMSKNSYNLFNNRYNAAKVYNNYADYVENFI